MELYVEHDEESGGVLLEPHPISFEVFRGIQRKQGAEAEEDFAF